MFKIERTRPTPYILTMISIGIQLECSIKRRFRYDNLRIGSLFFFLSSKLRNKFFSAQAKAEILGYSNF